MAQPSRGGSGGGRDRRNRGGDGGAAPGRRPQALSPEVLAEIADELEEHGRALIERARQLRRAAARPRSEAPARPRPGRGGRAEGGERKRTGGEAPDWAPKPRRKGS